MSEYRLPKGWPERIRAAQRDLIEAAGGIERVAKFLGRSVGHVGRWNNPREADLMPLPVIMLLEDDTKDPVFLRMMARLIHDRDLTAPDGDDGTAGDVLGHVADAVESSGKLGGQAMRFASDGALTESELMMLDRTAGELERDASEIREVLARHRSQIKQGL